MRCKCGFENAADARFCGSCRSPLGVRADSTVPSAAPPTAPTVPSGGGGAVGRPVSRVTVAIVVAIAIVGGAGYWWLNRPPGVYEADNSGLFPINVDGKYGFMDRSGKTVISPQFEMAFGFSEGLAHVQVGAKSGYINTKGTMVITPQFDDALQFQYGRAAVKLCCGLWAQQKPDNRFGFIDKDGKYISSPDFSWVGFFSGDLAPIRTAGGALAFLDRSGKMVLADKVENLLAAGFTEGLAPAASGGKWGFIDQTGKWVVNPQFESASNFADGLAPVVVGGRWGYIDQKGKFVVNPQYDFGDWFHEGYAAFKSGGMWGFIDNKGRVVVDPKFLEIRPFSDGLAPVKTADGWGFIDRTGQMVVSPQFDSADVFQNGLARVTALGKEAYVTTTGKFVIDPFPGTNPRAERARLAAEVARIAAKVSEDEAAAAAANRAQVEQGIAGEWVGSFGRVPKAQLSITYSQGSISALLLNEGSQETLRGELRADNKLLLTGIVATRGGRVGNYSLDTIQLELTADGGSLTGAYRDAAGTTGFVAMKRIRSSQANPTAAKPPTDKSPPSGAAQEPPTRTPTENRRTACVYNPIANVRSERAATSRIVCSISTAKTINITGGPFKVGRGIWWATDVCGQPGYIANNQIRIDQMCP